MKFAYPESSWICRAVFWTSTFSDSPEFPHDATEPRGSGSLAGAKCVLRGRSAAFPEAQSGGGRGKKWRKGFVFLVFYKFLIGVLSVSSIFIRAGLYNFIKIKQGPPCWWPTAQSPFLIRSFLCLGRPENKLKKSQLQEVLQQISHLTNPMSTSWWLFDVLHVFPSKVNLLTLWVKNLDYFLKNHYHTRSVCFNGLSWIFTRDHGLLISFRWPIHASPLGDLAPTYRGTYRAKVFLKDHLLQKRSKKHGLNGTLRLSCFFVEVNHFSRQTLYEAPMHVRRGAGLCYWSLNRLQFLCRLSAESDDKQDFLSQKARG